MFYIVYRQKEVIDGPFSQEHAHQLLEDLEMLFEDKHYQVLTIEEVVGLKLGTSPRFHIHEDIPPPD